MHKALFCLIFQNKSLKNLHSRWNHEQQNIDLGEFKQKGKKTKILAPQLLTSTSVFFHWFWSGRNHSIG